MHQTRPAKITSSVVSLGGEYTRIFPVAFIIAAVAIVLAILTSSNDAGYGVRFMYGYLVNYAFLLSICLGCLFFVTIMHLTRAGWSVTLRRIAELYAMCLGPMAILFLPILVPVLMNSDMLYPWAQGGWSEIHASAETVEAIRNAAPSDRPPLEIMKYDFWLNSGFFTVRWAIYFAIWFGMASFFLFTSLKQDHTGDKKLTDRMQAFAAPGMIVFAATIVFSSFDLEMSLEPLWFSTMFPVYFFAGAMLSALATITLTALYLQRSQMITDEVTVEHYHDMGKLMFGFVVFWGYIAFSQFLLIWYANIPEETFWYDVRINATGRSQGWQTISYVLLVGHLFVPFLAMMGRTVRRNREFLAYATVYLLIMHWLDHFWLVVPQYTRGLNSNLVANNFLGDLFCTIGMISAFVGIFTLIARDRPLVPMKDPRLGEALNHEVH